MLGGRLVAAPTRAYLAISKAKGADRVVRPYKCFLGICPMQYFQ